MRKEYNFNELKVKRRGLLPELSKDTTAKIKITLSLDVEVVEYFKHQAEQNGESNYQQQINLVLRRFITE